MSHKFDDICITGCEIAVGKPDKVQLLIDPKKEPDGADMTCLYLTTEDIAELASHLNLVVYHKDAKLNP